MPNHFNVSARLSAAACIYLLLQCGFLEQAEASTHGPANISSPAPETLTPEMRGDLLMIRKQYQEAIEAYRSSPERSALLWNKIGIAYHHLYDMEDAKTAYEHALRIKPDYGTAVNNLGAVYYAQKQFKMAERLYRRATKLMPQEGAIRMNLGTVYFAQGKFHKGMEAYRAAFAIDPDAFDPDSPHIISEPSSASERINLNYCLAAVYAQAGMTDRAIEFLRMAISEGFNDYKRLIDDQQFAALRKTPKFSQLLTEERRN
ncbi:tetratricopeptide repeat protein [Terracidiphilus sp.]|jgi:tetratricopeptide (TPR) repeat protein|uniref:tetratricopeptide repeat protein n=1 Tax=Terracidiphilus sp. TaxID=1964191 RepID=UPI003C20D8F1